NKPFNGLSPSATDKLTGLVIYDATDCTKPTIAAKIQVPNEFLHYMTLWRDPNRADRVFASVTFDSGVPEDGVDIRVYDLTGCPKSCNPKLAGEWGLRAQLGVPANVTTKYEEIGRASCRERGGRGGGARAGRDRRARLE